MALEHLHDILALAEYERPAWDDLSAAIPAWHPRNEGDDDDTDTDDEAGGAADEKDETGEDDTGKKADEGDKIDWKREARKHEARAKKATAERDAHAKKLSEIETSNLSDKEKDIAKAREEAKAEAQAEAATLRRADKLEVAVTRLAASKGVTIGEGDKAKTVKFADPDDVQMWLERQIANGSIDADDLYKDGKVDTDALADALADLARSKPSWLVGTAGSTSSAAAGDLDAGRGTTPKGSTVDSEFQRIRQHK